MPSAITWERDGSCPCGDRKVVVPKSCKTCYGDGLLDDSGMVAGGIELRETIDCPDCGGTGTRMTTDAR